MNTATQLDLPAGIERHVFGDPHGMATALADRVAAMLRHAVGARGRASLVLAGGRSPIPFFAALAQRDLPWAQIDLTLADERWVPADHPDSNAGLVGAHLLQGAAAAARFVPLYGGEATPEEGLAACAERLAGIARPFDVVLLGMGEDGHFASLFPGVPGLAAWLVEEGAELAAVHPPAAPHPRISLTLAALLRARNLLLQIQGVGKLRTLEAAARGDALDFPVGALLRQDRAPVQVFFSPAE